MSNKISKNKPKEKPLSAKEERLKKGQQFFGTTKLTNKLFSIYMNRSKLENVKRRNVIHQIISSVLIEVVVISLGYVYSAIALVIAAMLCCVFNAAMALIPIKNNENKKQQIALIISQGITFILGIIAMIIPGPV